jgi:hypothetical protein
MILNKTFFLTGLFVFGSFITSAQKINGLSFVASKDSIRTNDVSTVIDVNANYVALMPFGFIRDLSSPKIFFNTEKQWFGEREQGVIQYAKQLQKRSVKIMIKPQIWVWKGQFTGHISMHSEEQWKVLEDSYTSFILTYAKTAQTLKADILCIGTELEKFVNTRPEYWKFLILKIKKIFKGKLTYAANWDEFKRFPLWDQLDYIGIDAYFPLTDKKLPSVQEFEAGWELHKKEIYTIHKRYNSPILFTEYGYRSVDFTGKEPWNSKRFFGQVNLQAQINGLQAIHNQFWNEEWFLGGFIWKWFQKHNRVGGQNDNRFTPQNKPAENLLRNLYRENL